VPEWPLNRSQKNVPKRDAVNGTSLLAIIMGNHRARRHLKNERKKTNMRLLRQQVPDWPLNRSQKHFLKGDAVNGTSLLALIMGNHRARRHLKNERKKKFAAT
jgi:NADPH-dependent glutamate synthase beta subunit-like oxidoreductase